MSLSLRSNPLTWSCILFAIDGSTRSPSPQWYFSRVVWHTNLALENAKLCWLHRGTLLYLDIERAARRHTLVWGCAGGATASHQSTVVWLVCGVWWAQPMGSRTSYCLGRHHGDCSKLWGWTGWWTDRIHPRISPSVAERTQDVGQNAHGALFRGRSEWVQTDNMAMSAMMAVLKVDHDCQYTLSRVIDEAQRALAA
jgi:hypothetical protein